VCAYGPDSKSLASEVAARVRDWDAAGGPGMAVQVEVHPPGTPAPPEAWLILDKKDGRVVIGMQPTESL
jgi:hypothetical protein